MSSRLLDLRANIAGYAVATAVLVVAVKLFQPSKVSLVAGDNCPLQPWLVFLA